MQHTISLRCNTCGGDFDIDARTALVVRGRLKRSVSWSCVNCKALQWTALPTDVQTALKLGARDALNSQARFTVVVDGVCGLTSVVPLRELATYPKIDSYFAIWECRVCNRDRVSAAVPELVARVIQNGGVSMSEGEGAMIELLAHEDYQPHAAMQRAFTSTEGPSERV